MAECIDIPPTTQPTVSTDEEFSYSGVGIDTLTPEQERFTEARIEELLTMLLKTRKERCSFFVYGRSKTGKSSLINALLYGKSSGGNYTENVGTTEIKKINREIPIEAHSYKSMTVYDTVGLRLGQDMKTMAKEISENCPSKKMDCVIVCQDWTDVFEEKILYALHFMDPRIWTKTIFAMTKFDQLPPEIEEKENEQEQIDEIMKKKRGWEESIKSTLRKLEVQEDVIQHVQIVFTTHTAKKTHNWKIYGEDDYHKKFIEKVFNSIEDIDQYLAMRNHKDDILTTKEKIRCFLEGKMNMPTIYAVCSNIAAGNMKMALRILSEHILKDKYKKLKAEPTQ